MDDTRKLLITYRVETDDEDRGEFVKLTSAEGIARPEDYIIEVIYREVRTKVLKLPKPKLTPEIKKGDWLVLSGEDVKRFYIDISVIELSEAERKDLIGHVGKLFARYSGYMPFSCSDDIKTITIQYKKFGVRLLGTADTTTEWAICNTMRDAKSYLTKTYGVKAEDHE